MPRRRQRVPRREVRNYVLHQVGCPCQPDDQFACPGCNQAVGYCLGADDDRPELCDDCWARALVVT